MADSVDGIPAIANLDLDEARGDHEPGWLNSGERGRHPRVLLEDTSGTLG